MKALILVEHDQGTIKPATYHTISAAAQLSDDIDLLIIGKDCHHIAQQASLLAKVRNVLVVDHLVYEHQLAENCAEVIAQVSKNYTYILAGSSTFSKNILPRVAGLLDVGMISDVMKILSSDTFVRPMYAGNILATVRSKDAIKILTIRSTAFVEIEKNNQQAPISQLSIIIPNTQSEFKNQQLTRTKRPELTAAKIIISGGRGLKSAENFRLLEEIADKLGAAIGASRAAVDAGFAPNDYQIGQTGKIVAPHLYIAVGISGAIQHLAGMKDSKLIVAINNDPDAPIFQIADVGLIGDLFKILPELKLQLDKILS